MIVEKANMYATILGHDVTIVTMLQPRHEPNTFLLSDRVKQVFLEFPLHSMYKYKYPMRLWAKWHTYRLLRKEATKAIMQIDPDILLGASQVYADLVSTIRCREDRLKELRSQIVDRDELIEHFNLKSEDRKELEDALKLMFDRVGMLQNAIVAASGQGNKREVFELSMELIEIRELRNEVLNRLKKMDS